MSIWEVRGMTWLFSRGFEGMDFVQPVAMHKAVFCVLCLYVFLLCVNAAYVLERNPSVESDSKDFGAVCDWQGFVVKCSVFYAMSVREDLFVDGALRNSICVLLCKFHAPTKSLVRRFLSSGKTHLSESSHQV